MIRPWGYVQHYCGLHRKTRNKLKRKLPVILFINSLDQESSLISRVEDLHVHLNALEIFLREYVVDINYLKTFKKIRDDKESLPNNDGDNNKN